MFVIINYFGSAFNDKLYDSEENAAIAICNYIVDKLMHKGYKDYCDNITLIQNILHFNKLLQNKEYISAAGMSILLIRKTMTIKYIDLDYPKSKKIPSEFLKSINDILKEEVFK